MMHDPEPALIRGSCACGTCTFEIDSPPQARLLCHCTICQSFTGNDHADVALVPAARARFHNANQISFKKYKRFRFPPPNLARGRCRICGRPVVESFGSGPMQLLFIPSVNFGNPELLPQAGARIFYEHRRTDAEDDIPRHEGYFGSQLAIGKLVLRAFRPVTQAS